MHKSFVLILLLTLLASCSSANVNNVGCDFVSGAYESEQSRRHDNNAQGSKHSKDSEDTVNGLLSALFGSLNRSISPKNKKNGKCT